MLEKGNILKKKYEVLRKIGKGGMSTVWLVRDLKLGKDWALKEIDKNSAQYRSLVSADGTLQEVEILKQLDHPCAPRVVDIYENSESICIVMDYIDGQSLQELLNREGAQDQALVAGWMIDVCTLLSYLHKKHLIYRDLKPSNIILTREGNIKIIDYGITKMAEGGRYFDEIALGTDGYASPEHRSKTTDERSDIYTAGMTMYHLLSGDSPSRKGFHQVPLRKINPGISSGLEQIVMKCTLSDPQDRYQSMGQLIHALENYRRLDASYIGRIRAKIRTANVLSVISWLVIAAGILVFEAGYLMDKSSYDECLSEAAVSSGKEEACIKAASLIPYRAEAYQVLTEFYQEQGFTKENFEEIDALYEGFEEYAHYLPAFLRSDDYEKLNYAVGYAYVTSYEETLQGHSKERLVSSMEYFRRAIKDKKALGTKAAAAAAFYNLGAFYESYSESPSIDSTLAKQMVTSLNAVTGTAKANFGRGATKINLATYNVVLEFIAENGKLLLDAGISRSTLENYVDSTELQVLSEALSDKTEENLREKLGQSAAAARKALGGTDEN